MASFRAPGEPPTEGAESSEHGSSERILLDRFLKALLPHFYPELGTWLVGERPVKVETLPTALAGVEERAADDVLWLEFSSRPGLLLHVEFQLEGRADLPERMAQYLALLVRTPAFKEKGARLACVVVYLDEEVYRPDPGFLDVAGEMGTHLYASYRVVRLWEEDPERLFAIEEPGLCMFGPFLRGDKVALLIRSREKIERSQLPEGLKRDLLGLLAALAGRLIKDREILRRFALEIERMGENYVLELWQERGLERGLQQGRELGLQQGRELGLQEGLQQGALSEARRAVLRVLSRRFGEVPEGVRAEVEKITALERLESLHDEAIVSPSLEAFRRLLA